MSSAHNSLLRRYSGIASALPARSELAISRRFMLCLACIVLDYALAPALYNGSTLWATATLALLIHRRGQAATSDGEEIVAAMPRRGQFAVYFALNAAIVVVGRFAGFAFSSAAASDAAAGAVLAGGKLLIVLPALVLFTPAQWRAVLSRYRAEFLAALVVLFTFFPYRLFHTVWPAYSQLIAALAFYGAKPFVAGLALVGQPIPIIFGPKINLEIVFWCSGYSALALFDTLVALIALLDWNELNPKRLFVAYVAGGAAILVANVVRICLLVLVGNLIDPKYAMGRFHVNAGWLFFAAVYMVILATSYRWMLSSAGVSPASNDRRVDTSANRARTTE